MASLFRAILSGTRQTCIRHTGSRYYSDSVLRTATSKWQLEGVPRPRSILEDDDAVIDLSEDSDVVDGAHPDSPPLHMRQPPGKPTPHEYKAHRETLRKAFPDGWAPPRKLSRQAMAALRELNRADPQQFNVPILADRFKVSPEAVRRILKSRWEPSAEKQTSMAIKERQQRQLFVKERAVKERVETRQVQELRKFARSSSRSDSGEEGLEFGVSSADTFTFR